MTEPLERQAIISGAAQSQIGRRLHRTGLDLTIEAALRAIDDAGLTVADIDGVSTYPGMGGVFGGATGAEVHDAAAALAQLARRRRRRPAASSGRSTRQCSRWPPVWPGTCWSTAPSWRAAAGPCGPAGAAGAGRCRSSFQFLIPYGVTSAANWISCYARRHMHDYGTTREQLGAIAISARTNAATNPQAIYTDPMTMDDYLTVRMISDPFGLYDCDVPCDGSTAVIVSHRDFAPDVRHGVVHVNAMGTALRGRPSWDQFDDLTTMAMRDSAASMWERTELTPADVDTAQLYDGFSWLAMAWIEALGFCGKGEGGPFVEGGARIAPDGDLPLNTWGGQLSGGRLHGFGFLHEGVMQLRGTANLQVPDCEVAAVGAGGGPESGCLLLTKGIR
ncbi:MAG: thiolase family protein [Acidimicrobiales bacterium]